MIDSMLSIIGKSFPLTELSCDGYTKMKASGMKFILRRFYAQGLGNVSCMVASGFLGLMKMDTLVIIGLGLVAFVFDTFGGIMVAKVMNLFSKEKINPMIGAAGISAFPMSARVVHKLGLEEDNQNFLLMHSIGVNVSGQIASVIAGGLILALVKSMLGG